MDSRIGHKFLNPGPGFGGSCFQKDILNLVYLCNFYNLEEVANYWQSVLDINNWQKARISKIIVNYLFGNVSGKKITILGFAFKANTNDTRESPAIYICKKLIEEGAILYIYDPKVSNQQINKDLATSEKKESNIEKSWIYSSSVEYAVSSADAIVILTEWDEFKKISWDSIYKTMRQPAWIFDARSVLNPEDIKNFDLNLWRVGDGSEYKFN